MNYLIRSFFILSLSIVFATACKPEKKDSDGGGANDPATQITPKDNCLRLADSNGDNNNLDDEDSDINSSSSSSDKKNNTADSSSSNDLEDSNSSSSGTSTSGNSGSTGSSSTNCIDNSSTVGSGTQSGSENSRSEGEDGKDGGNEDDENDEDQDDDSDRDDTGGSNTSRYFGTTRDKGYADDLWTALEKQSLVGDDSIESRLYEGKNPHGAFLETISLNVTVDGHKGKAIVKRNYGGTGATIAKISQDRGSYLKAITVMFQREDGFDAENENYFWVKYKPSGALHVNDDDVSLAGRIGKGSTSDGCIGCHKNAEGDDFLYLNDE